jgi:predicted GIY-YIG superfamily endonuclease
MQGAGKRFVYILRSDSDRDRHYVGITSDPERRLEWHNHGPCGQTLRHGPWSFVVVLEFPTERQAVRFERYLKTGSGRAFATRHFGDVEPAPTDGKHTAAVLTVHR